MRGRLEACTLTTIWRGHIKTYIRGPQVHTCRYWTPSESGTMREERNLGMSMETRPHKPVDHEQTMRWVTGALHKYYMNSIIHAYLGMKFLARAPICVSRMLTKRWYLQSQSCWTQLR